MTTGTRVFWAFSTSILLLAISISGYLGYRNHVAASKTTALPTFSRPVPLDGWRTIKDSVKYPELFYRAGLEGCMSVTVVIDSIGLIQKLRIDPPSPFDEAIKKGMQCVKWRPGKRGGKNVVDSIDLSFHFVSPTMRPKECVFLVDSF